MKMKTKRELCLRSQMAVFVCVPLLCLFISHIYKINHTRSADRKEPDTHLQIKKQKGNKEVRVRVGKKAICAQMSRNDRQITVADSPATVVKMNKIKKNTSRQKWTFLPNGI